MEPEKLLHTYLLSKDGNRPHLLNDVFSETATLEMRVKTDNITFPSVSRGRSAIADVLVRKFGQAYENVYTFCLQRPPTAAHRLFSCDWLVGMSEKGNGNVRIGCGRYDWEFQSEAPHLVSRLVITIEEMQILPPDRLDDVLDWLQMLPYPWCRTDEVVVAWPAIDALEPVLQYVCRDALSKQRALRRE